MHASAPLTAVAGTLALLLAPLLASPAMAQLAVVAAIADNDVAQRDLAATVVAAAAERWQMLSPQIDPIAVKACAAKDTACLQALARSRGASHLLLIGAGTITLRDHLVSVRLFDVRAPEPIFKESVRQTAGDGRPGALRALARDRLGSMRGPPPAPPLESVERAPVEHDSLGLALLLGGAAAIAITAGVGLALPEPLPGAGPAISAAGAAAAIAMAGAGAAVLVRNPG